MPDKKRTDGRSLKEQLRELQDAFSKQAPEEVLRVMKKQADLLAHSGIAEQSLGVGAKAPAFELPNADGAIVRLDELLRLGPVILCFYRGGWCPYCNLELRALQQTLPEFERLGATLVAVSPATPDNSLISTEKHSLQFPVVSDRGNRVARQFGLVFTLSQELRTIYKQFGIEIPKHNGDEKYQLPIPATYLIDRDRIIRFAFVHTDYTQRAEPADLVAALRRLRTSSMAV